MTGRDVGILGVALGLLLTALAWRVHCLSPSPLPLAPGAALPPPRIDLNRASLAEIEALPEVGPVLAAAIVSGRPYRSLGDLARVPGMGPRTVERVAPWVAFGASP